MDEPKICANCVFFEEHFAIEDGHTMGTGFGRCTLRSMSDRICRMEDSCSCWETNVEWGKKKYLQVILHDIASNLKEVADVLDDIEIS